MSLSMIAMALAAAQPATAPKQPDPLCERMLGARLSQPGVECTVERKANGEGSITVTFREVDHSARSNHYRIDTSSVVHYEGHSSITPPPPHPDDYVCTEQGKKVECTAAHRSAVDLLRFPVFPGCLEYEMLGELPRGTCASINGARRGAPAEPERLAPR